MLFLSLLLVLGQDLKADQVERFDQLEKALEDPNSNVRTEAAKHLGQMAVVDSVKPLLKALEREELGTPRTAMIIALGRVGPRAKVAVKPLTEIWKNKKDRQRFHALSALLEIGPVSRETATGFFAYIRASHEPWAAEQLVRCRQAVFASYPDARKDAVAALVAARYRTNQQQYFDDALCNLACDEAKAALKRLAKTDKIRVHRLDELIRRMEKGLPANDG